MPGLGRLDRVAHARREQDDRVGQARDLDLGLPDADGLDQHHVAAGRVQDPQRLRRRPGQAAQVAAAGHRADVDVRGRARAPASGPGPRAAPRRRTARRVDRQDAHPLAEPAVGADQALVVVDLPTPGAPVRPITAACPPYGTSAAIASRSSGDASSTSEISRATERASPSRARRTARRRRASARSANHPLRRRRHAQDERVALAAAAAGAAAPTPPPRRRSSSARVSTSRAPLMPIRCPMRWPRR